MSALPYPTRTRLAVADEIAAGFIRWYNFDTPQAFHTVSGFRYTAALDELVAAGLARVPSCAEGASSIAELTDLAAQWRGSTSPEPGPAANECDHSATERQGEAIFCADCGVMTAGPDGEVAP